MLKERTVALVLVLAIVSVLVAGLWGFSTSQQAGPTGQVIETVEEDGTGTAGIPPDLLGKAAEISVAAWDGEADSSTQVSTDGYYWVKKRGEENYLYGGQIVLSSSSRTTIQDLEVGDRVRLVAFNATYDYGDMEERLIDGERETVNLDVYAGSTTQTLTYFDENGQPVTNTTAGVTVGSTNYIFDKVRIENTDDNSLWKVQLLGWDYADNTNISEVRVSGASRFTGSFRETNGKQAEDWYTVQADLNDDLTRVDSGAVTVVTNGNDVASETLTARVKDVAPYITKENTLDYSYENDANNAADVGVADATQAITLV